jgi:hypothetical protein
MLKGGCDILHTVAGLEKLWFVARLLLSFVVAERRIE